MDEYQSALKHSADDDQFATPQREALVAQGLAPTEIERVMEPTLSFHLQLQEEINWYERVRRREFDALLNLRGIGRLLIALRIANGMTQRELAQRLNVSESQVSRDERNEYHEITIDRAQRILEALGETLESRVEERPAASVR